MRQRRGFAQRLLQPGPHAGGLSDRNQRALPFDRARPDRCRRDLREGAAVGIISSKARGGQVLALTLVIGNKNYSSWSFRPWIAMKVAGIAFDEVVISLDAAGLQVAGVENFRHRQGAGAGRRRYPRLGIAGDPGISRREVSRRGCGRPNRRHGRMRARSRPKCMRASCRCAAHADEHAPAGQEARTARKRMANVRRIEAMWANAARASAAAGRFCSARSAPPTPCMRRWSRVFTPTSRGLAPARAYMDAMRALPAWRVGGGRAQEPWVLRRTKSTGRRF